MSVVKEGYMRRYTKSGGRRGWVPVYVRLFSDSYIIFYNRPHDNDPRLFINMKLVCKHFARGEHVLRNYERVPPLPDDATSELLLAIPEQPSHRARPHFLLTPNGKTMNEWMKAICSVLPRKLVPVPIFYSHGHVTPGLDSGRQHQYRGPYPQQPYPQNPYPDSGYPGTDVMAGGLGSQTVAKGLGKFGRGRCASWTSIDSIGSVENLDYTDFE